MVYFVTGFGPFCGEDWYPFNGENWYTLSYHLHMTKQAPSESLNLAYFSILCGDTSSFDPHQSQMFLGRTKFKWFLVSENRENIPQHFMDAGTLSHISRFCTAFFFIICS